MEPVLFSVKLDSLEETATKIEIKYKVPKGMEGVELMGVDAGLSWIKNESIKLEKTESNEDFKYFTGYLSVDSSCEFRARGYANGSDYWEAGLGNHRIELNEDRSIKFITHLDNSEYQFRGGLPTEFNPKMDDVIQRVENLEDETPSLFQTLVDLSCWIETVVEDPLNDEKIFNISSILRYLIPKIRNKNSYKVDEIARPVLAAFFKIYKSAIEFHEEDENDLINMWENEGWLNTIRDLPEKVKELEDLRLGLGKDAEKRFLDLLKYI